MCHNGYPDTSHRDKNFGSIFRESSLPCCAEPKPPRKAEPPKASPMVNADKDVVAPRRDQPAKIINKLALLVSLVADYTGVDGSEVSKDTALADLGLDSLASVEFLEELRVKLGLIVDSDELLTSTINSLNQRLGGSSPDSSSDETEPRHTPTSSENTTSPAPPNPESDHRRQQILQMLVDVSGAKAEDIEPTHELLDIGVDSLAFIDLKQELEAAFSVSLDRLFLDSTVKELMKQFGVDDQNVMLDHSSQSTSSATLNAPSSEVEEADQEGEIFGNFSPFDALAQADAHFGASANQKGFVNYWSDVAPSQNEILIAYIVEAFKTLGVDLSKITPGNTVPQIPYQTPKYKKLVSRLWEILQKHEIVAIGQANSGNFTRGNRAIDPRSSSQLIQDFSARFPAYEHETNLMGLTGPKLADCLSGKSDPVALMFGSPTASKIMENYYGQSPMLSTLTEKLVIFIKTLLSTSTGRPRRILEVGAGTGGTTRRLAEALDSAGIVVQYTFTDISAGLVAKAKNKFKQYPWMKFTSFNMEKEIPINLQHQFDIVIATNCVHATTDRTASCRRLREALTSDGILVLSEVTQVIDWYDVSFGLLDGWWLAEHGTAYPIQPANSWVSVFKAAGFAVSSYSQGPTLEANSQQLLLASNKFWNLPAARENTQGDSYHLETMVYKEVNDIPIHADVFFPTRVPQSPIPVALMIHGGGHMTLSRKAIRPHQTRHLLANNFLPISIDYRLCPEVNLTDGPITDVFDAYRWIQTSLPQIALRHGIQIDHKKIVAIGWPTGGHLALSLGWTTKAAGIAPPAAVLRFYSPYDFESGELDSARLAKLPGRTMNIESIIKALPQKAITNYDASDKGDSTNLGWVRPGDPRSELVLSLFKEGTGFPLLLHGLPDPSTPVSEWFQQPSAAEIAAISPLAQLRKGNYDVPTFVIHGTKDQIALFGGAERFVGELRRRGVRNGFLVLEGREHIHDLGLREGSEGWEREVAPGYRFLCEVVRG